jgi:anti-anti-sigma factor
MPAHGRWADLDGKRTKGRHRCTIVSDSQEKRNGASPATFDIESVDGIRTVVVHGDVDISSATLLKDAIVGGDGADVVTLDLSDCRYMDSSGLSALISASRKLGSGFPIVLGRGSFLRKLFRITGLDAHFTLHEDRDAARRSREGDAEPPPG